jgi:hypothetical protein
MNLPKFTAESALSKSTRIYRGQPRFGSFAQSGQPAIAVQPSQFDAGVIDAPDEAGPLDAEGAEGGDDAEELSASGVDEGIGDDEGDDSDGEDAGEE